MKLTCEVIDCSTYRSVVWVKQRETQHTQPIFFHLLGDIYIGSDARNENRVDVVFQIQQVKL
jgi:hypothetical protein